MLGSHVKHPTREYFMIHSNAIHIGKIWIEGCDTLITSKVKVIKGKTFKYHMQFFDLKA